MQEKLLPSLKSPLKTSSINFLDGTYKSKHSLKSEFEEEKL